MSEVGFGLWTISTGWWGNFTEGEAIALMHMAFDLGITIFDAADTYGNGLSEELIAKAFPKQRDEITIALGQAALQWLLTDERVASTLSNIYNEEQVIEFAKAPDCPALTNDDFEKIAELYAENFGVEREEPKFKGTMEPVERPTVAAV